MRKYENHETVHKYGLEFKRVGTSAVLRLKELNDFMYIMRESERVSWFIAGGKTHYVYAYHGVDDFSIATEFKPGWARVPDVFTTTGHLI